MFATKNNEVTVIDLADEFEQAKSQYELQVEAITRDADERQQVVRNRMAVLEKEDTDLQSLQHRLQTP